MNSRTLYVIDKQNQDGTWQGVASLWGVVDPNGHEEVITQDVLAAVLAVFKDNDQTGVYRLVQKVRTEQLDEQVIG